MYLSNACISGLLFDQQDIKSRAPLIGLMLVFTVNNFTSAFIFELVPPVSKHLPTPILILMFQLACA